MSGVVGLQYGVSCAVTRRELRWPGRVNQVTWAGSDGDLERSAGCGGARLALSRHRERPFDDEREWWTLPDAMCDALWYYDKYRSYT